MGLIDDLKGKAQGLVKGNEEAIRNGIEKAGDFVDSKTGGKYAGHIDKVQDGAGKLVDKVDGDSTPSSTDKQPPAQTPPPAFPPTADKTP